MTPLIFFLWGYVKTVVYTIIPHSLADCKTKITNAISTIGLNQLTNVCKDLQNRITFCITNDSGHVEN